MYISSNRFWVCVIHHKNPQINFTFFLIIHPIYPNCQFSYFTYLIFDHFLSCQTKDWCYFKIVNYSEVMLEKQLTGHRVDRSICDWFWEQSVSQGDSFKVPNYVIVKAQVIQLIFILTILNFLSLINWALIWILGLIAFASNRITDALPFPNRSRGDHIFSLYTSWNATIDGHWGEFAHFSSYQFVF